MDEYKAGQFNALCDRCGFKYKSGQLRLEWNNLRTCSGPQTNNCWEPRHPQDKVRARKDDQSIPWARPEAPDVENAPGVPDWDAL